MILHFICIIINSNNNIYKIDVEIDMYIMYKIYALIDMLDAILSMHNHQN